MMSHRGACYQIAHARIEMYSGNIEFVNFCDGFRKRVIQPLSIISNVAPRCPDHQAWPSEGLAGPGAGQRRCSRRLEAVS
jgi:hypothetical protein